MQHQLNSLRERMSTLNSKHVRVSIISYQIRYHVNCPIDMNYTHFTIFVATKALLFDHSIIRMMINKHSKYLTIQNISKNGSTKINVFGLNFALNTLTFIDHFLLIF
jgi:hypothetical protein